MVCLSSFPLSLSPFPCSQLSFFLSFATARRRTLGASDSSVRKDMAGNKIPPLSRPQFLVRQQCRRPLLEYGLWPCEVGYANSLLAKPIVVPGRDPVVVEGNQCHWVGGGWQRGQRGQVPESKHSRNLASHNRVEHFHDILSLIYPRAEPTAQPDNATVYQTEGSGEGFGALSVRWQNPRMLLARKLWEGVSFLSLSRRIGGWKRVWGFIESNRRATRRSSAVKHFLLFRFAFLLHFPVDFSSLSTGTPRGATGRPRRRPRSTCAGD
ncbi:hypothetical protein MPH_04046 [Macrophomina phaseolina MS6]|uniref:Uncharacterized protein n=1 Tax=Macrophomina phaseolina (strain MS6) TaxID=1126212 RepID=K2SPJ5_MACPH|nr:hypothetical protein MPH_04046 [Macrophomina phaseolina MS6]